MTTTSGPAVRRDRAWPLRWAVFALPPVLRGYVITIIVAGAAAITTAAVVGPWRARDAILAASLIVFGVAAVEITRRASPGAGVIKDVPGVWLLPLALLLPPFYALAGAAVTFAVQQLRVRATVPHRRVFSAAAYGLALAAASLLSGALHLRGLALRPGTAETWLTAAVSCALLWAAANKALVLTVARLADPAVRIRQHLAGRESLITDSCEIGAGLLLAMGLTAAGPLALIPALPLVVMLRRGARYAQLRDEHRTDDKTGLLTAAAWRAEAEIALAAVRRARQPAAVAIADLDHFKQVNDTLGHLAGDLVLGAAGRILAAGLRPGDLAGRFGGEEFVLLLRGVDDAQAQAIADRLRSQLAALALPATPARVTMSVGIAVTLASSGSDLTDLLAAADTALYQAKNAGRNATRAVTVGSAAT